MKLKVSKQEDITDDMKQRLFMIALQAANHVLQVRKSVKQEGITDAMKQQLFIIALQASNHVLQKSEAKLQAETDELQLIMKYIKLHSKGSKGMAELFVEHVGNKLILASDSKLYLYNDQTKLYMLFDLKNNIVGTIRQELLNSLKKSYASGKKHSYYYNRFINWLYRYNCLHISDISNLLVKNYEFIKNLNGRKSNLLPIKGGLIIDLSTGKSRERTINDYFTFELDVEWKGLYYKTPFIDKFITNIMNGDDIMVDYLQKVLGYSITNCKDDNHEIIVFAGSGNNGKTSLLCPFKRLLSDYYGQQPSNNYLDDYGVIKKDANKVFVQTNQPISMICRDKYSVIPFNVDFSCQPKVNGKYILQDYYIHEKVYTYRDELLVWLINGSMKYFKDGLVKPDKVINAAKQYHKKNE